jgi:hypothetical protein
MPCHVCRYHLVDNVVAQQRYHGYLAMHIAAYRN